MEAISLRLKMDIEQAQPLSFPWLEKFTEMVYTLRLELADAAALDARIAVTTKDGNFFKQLYPYMQYSVLNHGLTFDEFSLPDIEPEPHTLVFVGNYKHYPNMDAMEFFFNQIWPIISSAIPDVRVILVGPNPPEKLIRIANDRRITLTGGVPDIRPHIQKASIGIAPLISGAGMRGKVLDYAAMHRTFVATSLAVTDLVFEDGVDFHCADTAQEFAQKIIDLLKNEQLARTMSASAFTTALQNYDNHRLTDFLVRLYEHLERE
jgi:glycosyltransferase involved in cell wall biosynthesis